MSIRRGSDMCCDACDRRLVTLSQPLCVLCHRYVQPDGSGCSCESGDVFPGLVYAPGLFDPAWRALVHSLKYGCVRALARPLAQRLSVGLSALPPVEVIVPVPTDPRKRRERGFGHAELLAEHLAEFSQRTYLPQALGFTRRVADQTRLSGDQRKANVKDAFRATEQHSVRGKSVLIVDDVMTTGATITEAGGALREAGAAAVYGAVIALNLGHVPDGPRG
jgi:ComF family protein